MGQDLAVSPLQTLAALMYVGIVYLLVCFSKIVEKFGKQEELLQIMQSLLYLYIRLKTCLL